tara:strand:+ start:6591 stop:8015 length:1425 start_codon:yes stop_codon:yes gene_type:complete
LDLEKNTRPKHFKMSSPTKVCVQGLGFVGSAMSTALSSRLDENNHPIFDVVGIDRSDEISMQRIDSINAGKFPFPVNDQNLLNELSKSVSRGNLRATYNTDNYSDAEIILVSINCDLKKENGEDKIALKSFTSAIEEIAQKISENTLLIVESTVPPGTCEKIIYPLFEKTFLKRNIDINKFFLAHSYERVMPGADYFDSIINFWRVYAGINDESSKRCGDFLSKLINTKDFPLTMLSNTTSSETGKVLENSYRAVNIAFIEEWGRFAEEVGIDLYEIIDAIRMRPTHNNIRQPGFGVGGYCLTKDPLFAKIAAEEIFNLNNHDFLFSSNAVKTNNKMPLVASKKIKEHFNKKISDKNFLLMGITYREDVGDTRFSPSETFVKSLLSEGSSVDVYDPLVSYWNEMKMNVLKDLPSSSNYDGIIFAVNHTEFKNINLASWIGKEKVLLLDANNVLTKKQLQQVNETKINYKSIGRG